MRFVPLTALCVVLAIAGCWAIGRRAVEPLAQVPRTTPEPGGTVALEDLALRHADRTARDPRVAASAATEPVRSIFSELRGRLVFEDGAPAAGVSVVLNGTPSPDREHAATIPLDDVSLEHFTDREGRFVISFLSPAEHEWSLGAKLPGHARLEWRFDALEAGTFLELADRTVVRGGTLTGRVLDAEGRPLRTGFLVHAAASSTSGFAHGERVVERAGPDLDGGPGEFVLEDLEPGRYPLFTLLDDGGFARGPTVEVLAGRTAACEIHYRGPDPRRTLGVSLASRFLDALPSPSRVQVVDSEGHATRPQRLGSILRFANLDPDERYRLEVDDPRFDPFTLEGLRPGLGRTNARLRGSSGLRVHVVDATTGAPVEALWLRVRDRSADRFETLLPAWSPLPEGGLFEDVVPDSFVLRAGAAGYEPLDVAVDELLPGEIRTLNIALEPSAVLAGLVRSAGGLAEDGARVSLNRGGIPVAETTTDARGGFRFSTVGPGRYTLTATAAGGRSASFGELELGLRPGPPVLIEVPDGVHFSGHVTGLDAVELPTLQLVASAAGIGHGRAAVERTGEFALAPLRAGPTSFHLEFAAPDREAPFRIELGSVELTEPRTARTFHLAGREPGELVARVSVNGAPLPGITVEARRWRSDEDFFRVPTDSEGLAHLGPVPAGSYELRAVGAVPGDAPGEWLQEAFDTVLVRPGERRAESLFVPLTEGELLILDGPRGDPFPDSWVTLTHTASDRPFEVHARTDASGRATFVVPPGTYTLTRRGPREPDALQPWIDWTTEGPLHPVVKLPY